jgi:hypothetical protein
VKLHSTSALPALSACVSDVSRPVVGANIDVPKSGRI